MVNILQPPVHLNLLHIILIFSTAFTASQVFKEHLSVADTQTETSTKISETLMTQVKKITNLCLLLYSCCQTSQAHLVGNL